MSYKACKKCKNKFKANQLVRCKNCNGCFDRKCAEELCDEAGEWVIPPTKLVKWSCTECQRQPARVCCDECERALESLAFAACTKCGRHECGTCSGLSRDELLRLRRATEPWLCRQCCESPKDVPQSWNNYKVFAAEYVRHPALWNPAASKTDLEHAHESLGRALGLPVAEVPERCKKFAHKFTGLLRRLAIRKNARTPAEVFTRYVTPTWIRETEERLQWLPSVLQSVWWPDEPEDVLCELARRVRGAGGAGGGGRRAVLALAAALACPAPALHDLWTQIERVALHKLQSLTLAGDMESALSEAAKMKPYEWLACDAALLHAPSRAGPQLGYLTSQVWLLYFLLRLVQQYSLETCRACELPARWIAAYRLYCSRGLRTSIIVLQRRWWELKKETRWIFLRRARGLKATPQPHHRLVATRYPSVVSRPIPSWQAMVRNKKIVDLTEQETQRYGAKVEPLPIADDDLILREIRQCQPLDEDSISTIEQANHAIELHDDINSEHFLRQLSADVELRNYNQMPNSNSEPLTQAHEANSTLLSEEYDYNTMEDSLALLKDPDPKISSAHIIFESDSDEEDKIQSQNNKKESDDECFIVDHDVETCELGDGDLEENDDESKCVDIAADPKLQMVPTIPLVRIDEIAKRNEQDLAFKIAVDALKDQLMCRETIKHETDTQNVVKTPENSASIGDVILSLRKDLIGYTIPDTEEEISDINQENDNKDDVKDIMVNVNVAKPQKDPEFRPWRYKGPLTGRVDELSWLCTEVSVALEKLPGLVLNNVKANSAPRRVELPDIEQVRRDNKRMLVAQVAPLQNTTEIVRPQQVERVPSVESTATSKSSRSTRSEENELWPGDPDNGSVITEEQISRILNEELPPDALSRNRCCLARRHRAKNDARLRTAARSGRVDNFTEYDMHGSKHGQPPLSCDCCCVHLLGVARPQSLSVLQRVLKHSLDSLLKRRGETPVTSDSQLSGSEHLKRLHTDAALAAATEHDSSSDEERLVIAAPPAKKPKNTNRPKKKKERRKSNVESHKNKLQQPTSKDANTKQKEQNTSKTNDDNDEERQKRLDLHEWMRQKNSHRRFFQLPGVTGTAITPTVAKRQNDPTIIYLSKSKSEIFTKKVSNPHSDHTYANEAQPSASAQTTPDASAITILPDPNTLINGQKLTTNAQDLPTSSVIPITKELKSKLTCVTIQPKNIDCQAARAHRVTSGSDSQAMSVHRVTSGQDGQDCQATSVHSVTLGPNSEPRVELLGGTLIPVTLQTNSVRPNAIFVTNGITPNSRNVADGQPSSYFMIYQDPNKIMRQSGPTVAIVPVTITSGPTRMEGDVSTQAKSIFQKGFRQQMVDNLSMWSGETAAEAREEEVLVDGERSMSHLDMASQQETVNTVSLFSDEEMPAEDVFEKTADERVSPNIFDDLDPPRGEPMTDIIEPPACSRVAPPADPTLPTISSVTSLPVISIDDDDDDDDCVITSETPRTIVIHSKKTGSHGISARFIKPVKFFKVPPEHISKFVKGWETAPFALLRLNFELPLWVMEGGELILTDTAVACRNIKYFIINSKELKRMVPVHFDPPAHAQGRIKVRSFAKLADGAGGEGNNELLMADNRLYRKLTHEPPIYSRVLTGISDVISARLLASCGYALHVYSPRLDALLPLRPAARRALRCENQRVAQQVADCFNACCPDNEERWSAAPPVTVVSVPTATRPISE